MIDSDSVKAVVSDLNAYFVARILNKEFLIEKFDKYCVEISIDGFQFTLWISSGESFFATECVGARSFMHLSFTDSERKIAYDIVHSAWLANERNTLLTEKANIEKRLEELK